VSETHDQIEELLAGYVLRSLSGADAAEADRLLTEHVPGCSSCRSTLDAFQAVAADLALEAAPVAPPETLLPRLHRELEPRGGRMSRWSPARIVAVAASVVLVVGLGGLAVTQLGSTTTLAPADLEGALRTATMPGATQTNLGHATEIAAPGLQEIYIYGEGVPAPPAGSEYALWALSGSSARYLGSFSPDQSGRVLLKLTIDPSTFDQLLVTAEPTGSQPSRPGDPAWSETG
jgi:hypothetical protein